MPFERIVPFVESYKAKLSALKVSRVYNTAVLEAVRVRYIAPLLLLSTAIFYNPPSLLLLPQSSSIIRFIICNNFLQSFIICFNFLQSSLTLFATIIPCFYNLLQFSVILHFNYFRSFLQSSLTFIICHSFHNPPLL